ncbi:unnamed protein product [Protopolystoma xenopodis]|uniref:Uncharacterized protein n=1 Tax=Protopolystoma xenopodis TaxID=117903 RepID=A0A448WBG4_9PLAT|nr:unnamed protein product [Protopolystoma xenopodis]
MRILDLALSLWIDFNSLLLDSTSSKHCQKNSIAPSGHLSDPPLLINEISSQMHADYLDPNQAVRHRVQLTSTPDDTSTESKKSTPPTGAENDLNSTRANVDPLQASFSLFSSFLLSILIAFALYGLIPDLALWLNKFNPTILEPASSYGRAQTSVLKKHIHLQD